jgi:hypothetical protein
MQQPVRHRRGDRRVAESCCPVSDPDVGRQNRGGLQVALIDHLEQRRRAVTGQRQVAKFVNHQELRAGEEPHAGRPPTFDRGLVTASGEIGRSGEIDPVSGLGRAARQRGGQHRFSHSGWPDEQNIRGVVQETQRGEVADQFLVDPGLRGEVEVRQRPRIRQAREPQPAGEATCFGGVDLDFQQSLERGGHGQVLVPDLIEDPG